MKFLAYIVLRHTPVHVNISILNSSMKAIASLKFIPDEVHVHEGYRKGKLSSHPYICS